MADENEIEKKAKAMGWSDKDSFRGDPDKWVDADTFVKRGETYLPILKERQDKLIEEIDRLKSQSQEDRKTFEQFREFATKAEERAFKQAESAHQKEISTLKAQLKSAAKEGDVEAIDRITQEIDSLKKPEAPVVEKKPDAVTPSEHPAFVDWKTRNQWYGADMEATAYAESVANFVKVTKPHLAGTPGFFDEVSNQVKEKFPTKFKNRNQDQAAAVEGASSDTQSSGKRKKSFADLPSEAKEGYERFKKIMPNFTKEQYLEQYDWGN